MSFLISMEGVMSLKKVGFGASIIIGLLLLGMGLSYSLGWFIGCIVVLIIRWNRKRFYTQIMDMTTFQIGQYVAYTASLFILMGGSFIIAFMFKSIINPYTLFSAFFAERIFMFFSKSLVKEEISNVSK